ncbi:MAG: hypothetical protein JW936_01275 [Sedimentisphaerales bacterium]|nr:hypothetical protein [Sedimentisphaerales bacterium]
MADKRWIGGAADVAQVDHVTPANVYFDDSFEITLADDTGASDTISFTATAASVQNVVEGLAAAAAAAKAAGTAPWDAVTVTEDDTKVIITADTAGVPFYVTTSTTDGGGTDNQTLTRSEGTANSGDNDYNTAANWSPAGVPEAADDVYFENDDTDILYGLDQSAVDLSSFNVAQSFTGTLGTTSAYLQIDADDVRIGYHNGPGRPSGSSRIRLDLGSNECDTVIENAGTASSTSDCAINLLANNSSSDVEIRKGKVGLGNLYGETATFGVVMIHYTSNPRSDCEVYVGAGVTLTTIYTAGVTRIEGLVTTINAMYGTLTTEGANGYTAVNVYGAAANLNAAGTIATLKGYNGAVIDLTKSHIARTVTDTKLEPGAKLITDESYVTHTNGIESIAGGGKITYQAA